MVVMHVSVYRCVIAAEVTAPRSWGKNVRQILVLSPLVSPTKRDLSSPRLNYIYPTKVNTKTTYALFDIIFE